MFWSSGKIHLLDDAQTQLKMYAYTLHFASPIDNSVANIVLCSRVNGACFSVLDTHNRRAWLLLRG